MRRQYRDRRRRRPLHPLYSNCILIQKKGSIKNDAIFGLTRRDIKYIKLTKMLI
jgi:hypothetical protein